MSEQFKPNATVAAIIHHQGKFLIVEEIDDGNVVYNQPAGHIEADENIINALKREVKEETGLAVDPECLSGIYYHYRAELNLYYLRFCFVCELDNWAETSPSDADIIQAVWLTEQELKAKGKQIRSPLVLECIDDYLAGKRYPLSILHSNI
ncbi:NUDIX hydrolase [Thalassomonas sp. M1454]|uniref:NUDIX hydrolase n=1 Tax=Thalassomonas sp. M1454 TaxID=2594477 RepID=UPI001180CD52|nr:NUDIX hydrolase [Thalassomonas sp. M1454]TRX56913.1 NUDIX hydrolase [Thalassomonas sp. M1454]